MEIPVSLSEFELLTSYKQSSYLTVLLVVIGICIPKIEHGSINSNKLLFRFCPTRWIEDQSVAERESCKDMAKFSESNKVLGKPLQK